MCLDCDNRWEAVAPLGVTWLECPACKMGMGRFKNYYAPDFPVWHCNCGNDLFFVGPAGVLCPTCGTEQSF